MDYCHAPPVNGRGNKLLSGRQPFGSYFRPQPFSQLGKRTDSYLPLSRIQNRQADRSHFWMENRRLNRLPGAEPTSRQAEVPGCPRPVALHLFCSRTLAVSATYIILQTAELMQGLSGDVLGWRITHIMPQAFRDRETIVLPPAFGRE